MEGKSEVVGSLLLVDILVTRLSSLLCCLLMWTFCFPLFVSSLALLESADVADVWRWLALHRTILAKPCLTMLVRLGNAYAAARPEKIDMVLFVLPLNTYVRRCFCIDFRFPLP